MKCLLKTLNILSISVVGCRPRTAHVTSYGTGSAHLDNIAVCSSVLDNMQQLNTPQVPTKIDKYALKSTNNVSLTYDVSFYTTILQLTVFNRAVQGACLVAIINISRCVEIIYSIDQDMLRRTKEIFNIHKEKVSILVLRFI